MIERRRPSRVCPHRRSNRVRRRARRRL